VAGVAELVDRAVALPPGPQLSAVLNALPRQTIPNARLVDVIRARSRQLAHEQAELFADMVEIAHAVAVADLAGERALVVERVEEQSEWASHEIAAGLTWTPTAADRELGFATALVERLPLVFASLRAGHIDRGKARVFVDYLDPANGDLTDQQSRRLCERFVPLAPGLTTRQLADRLYRALHAIDPDLRRRRYERAVRERGVALYLDPRTGTATLVGNGLPADEAAAAAERIDRLVEATKRAGHPARRSQISADLYLGMLNGAFHGLTENEIIDRLLATRRPADEPHTDIPDGHPTGQNTAPGDSPADDSPPDNRAPDDRPLDDSARGDGAPEDRPLSETAGDKASNSSTVAGAVGTSEAGAKAKAWAAQDAGRWARDRIATREGIEIRVGLGTLAGLDDRPGEIAGLGPVGAHLARTAVAGQRRGAAWRFAVVDSGGHLLLAGPLRRRPRRSTHSSPVRGGVVELHLTVDELRRYGAHPGLGEWAGVLAEIADAWAHRRELRRRLAANPHRRFARGPLADHVRTRDRNCCGPGCTRPARRSDLDHTRDRACGGDTVAANIGPACKRHHPDKDRGWSLAQPEPGLFLWVSPLGRPYVTKGEPVRPDLPDPDPAPPSTEESSNELDERLRRVDPRVAERAAEDPPARPPPP
jgi:hypothetical protein